MKLRKGKAIYKIEPVERIESISVFVDHRSYRIGLVGPEVIDRARIKDSASGTPTVAAYYVDGRDAILEVYPTPDKNREMVVRYIVTKEL